MDKFISYHINDCVFDRIDRIITKKYGRVYNIDFPLNINHDSDIINYMIPYGFHNTAFIQANAEPFDNITFLLNHLLIHGEYIKT